MAMKRTLGGTGRGGPDRGAAGGKQENEQGSIHGGRVYHGSSWLGGGEEVTLAGNPSVSRSRLEGKTFKTAFP